MYIYLDVDGTLADFWGHATSKGVVPLGNVAYLADPATWTPEQKKRQHAVDGLMSDPEFWLTIPPTENAFELISAACSRANTYLLTALPSFAKDAKMKSMIRRAKLDYAMDVLHFPASRVIICERKDKKQYAIRPDGARNLLVDDAEQNCAEWTANGGHAIFHVGIRSSIRDLKDVLHR